MTTVTTSGPSIRLGPRTYPVLLPSIRDPRFKIAATVVAVHVLGQVGLGFPLSISQILISVFTCALLEVAVLFWRKRAFEWPASAMLTGAGVALILRVEGTRHGDWWSLEGWYIFAGVSAASLLSKYIIRPRNTQIFNPNNLGLTVAFVVLGSSLVEPLDFWWGPMSLSLAAAVVVIMVGGLVVTAQVRMLAMPIAFWFTFAAFLGLLAASGHCISARWSVDPVCDGSFWRIVVTSPELLIFLFFMITDPKAIPSGNVARVAFAVVVAMLAVLLIAPQQTEFGAKVALLGSLTVFSAVHKYFERSFPAAGTEGDQIGVWLRQAWVGTATPRRGMLAVGGVGVFVIVVLAAGDLARDPAGGPTAEAAVRERAEVAIDAASLPPLGISEEAAKIYGGISDSEVAIIASDLLVNLEVEAAALRARDLVLAATVSQDSRLWTLERRIAAAEEDGEIVVPSYSFDSMEVVLIFAGENKPPVLGVAVRGSVREVTYGGPGGEAMVGEAESAFASTFAVAATGDGHYVIVGEVPSRS